MNEKYRIKVGDIVDVHIHSAQTTLIRMGEVIYTPMDAGDAWGFYDSDNDEAVFISEGCTIVKSFR